MPWLDTQTRCLGLATKCRNLLATKMILEDRVRELESVAKLSELDAERGRFHQTKGASPDPQACHSSCKHIDPRFKRGVPLKGTNSLQNTIWEFWRKTPHDSFVHTNTVDGQHPAPVGMHKTLYWIKPPINCRILSIHQSIYQMSIGKLSICQASRPPLNKRPTCSTSHRQRSTERSSRDRRRVVRSSLPWSRDSLLKKPTCGGIRYGDALGLVWTYVMNTSKL